MNKQILDYVGYQSISHKDGLSLRDGNDYFMAEQENYQYYQIC